MRLAIAFLFLFFSQFALAKGFVVSTHPIFLIAQDVTKGVEQPTLLLSAHHTGHDVQLTPKARQLIQSANLVLWVGKEQEAPLAKVLENKSYAIALLDTAMIKMLPQRTAKGESISASVDPHVWLEPHNAVRIAFFIAALRSQQYPEYKAKFWQNAQDFSKRMYDATKVRQINKELPYWAYHDAYQYLERSLNLKFSGALSVNDELAPTASQMHYLSQNRPQAKMCLLAEYHTDQTLIKILKPVVNVSVDESMSTQTDFVQGWIRLVNVIKQCD